MALVIHGGGAPGHELPGRHPRRRSHVFDHISRARTNESVLMKRRILPGLAIAVALSGCATPPGQLDDSDFLVASDTVYASVGETYGNFLQGLRYCGPETRHGIFLATHHGVPECSPPQPDGSVACDLYVSSAYGERSDLVLGRVDFSPVQQGTPTAFRVRTWAGGKSDVVDAWRKFTLGQAKGGVC